MDAILITSTCPCRYLFQVFSDGARSSQEVKNSERKAKVRLSLEPTASCAYETGVGKGLKLVSGVGFVSN